MEHIRLDNWIVSGNSLYTSLIRFNVEIKPLEKGYQIIITDNDKRTLRINSNTLEEAIIFTETTINHCNDLIGIISHFGDEKNNRK